MPIKEGRNSQMSKTMVAFSPRQFAKVKPVAIKAPMDKIRAHSVLKEIPRKNQS